MIQVESTPNPESLKFLSENTISAIGTEEFQKNDIKNIKNQFIKDLNKMCNRVKNQKKRKMKKFIYQMTKR